MLTAVDLAWNEVALRFLKDKHPSTVLDALRGVHSQWAQHMYGCRYLSLSFCSCAPCSHPAARC